MATMLVLAIFLACKLPMVMPQWFVTAEYFLVLINAAACSW